MNANAMDHLPIAIIGAGPVGLAAAAHAVERGLTPLVLERGPGPGAAMRNWGHVRLFSPWMHNIDPAAERLLTATGWTPPPGQVLPTGADIVEDYLTPLATLPALAPHLHFDARVTAIARQGLDRMSTARREAAPFAVRWYDSRGNEDSALVRAVVDASGTWHCPSPMGIDGLPVPGEAASADRISYGIPDVLERDRGDYAGHRVLVVGGGHSAINVVLDLLDLQEAAPGTEIAWALRRGGLERLVGGGLDDALPARGALGLAARRAIDGGRLRLLAPFAAERLASATTGITVHGRTGGQPVQLAVDRIVVATGFRPDTAMLRELRVELDPVTEAPPRLAPLIDPNLHSCGTVPPHGAAELAQPEPGLYIVGAKSYGRAPTFLMKTGYEQVRSVMAELAGDHEAARRVELVLPETGVCSGAPDEAPLGASTCCGGPAKSDPDACCQRDAEAREAGLGGCGCPQPEPSATAGCCG